MPSLYHHDKLTSTYANEERMPDEKLMDYNKELNTMLVEADGLPRQIAEINRILGYLTFELVCRQAESLGGMEA